LADASDLSGTVALAAGVRLASGLCPGSIAGLAAYGGAHPDLSLPTEHNVLEIEVDFGLEIFSASWAASLSATTSERRSLAEESLEDVAQATTERIAGAGFIGAKAVVSGSALTI